MKEIEKSEKKTVQPLSNLGTRPTDLILGKAETSRIFKI